jgi:hypothetical protein
MTNAREKIRSIINEYHVSLGIDTDKETDAILSALPSIAREMIPDLEFNENGFARAINAMYEMRQKGRVILLFRHERSARTGMGAVPRGEEHELYEAANEHHKQQILKAMGVSE